jgi:BON domain
MNRAGWKRFISQCIVGFGGVALCAVLAQAQQAAGTSANNGSVAATTGQRTDGQIEMDVVRALDASAPLKNDLITAATIQSEVTLSGTVSSQGSKDLAESIAKGVPGVTQVHNNLTVGNPQAAAQAQNLPDDQSDTAADEPQAPPQSEPMPAPDSSQAQAPPSPYPAPQPPYPTAQQPYPPAQQPYPQRRPQYSPYPAPPSQNGQQGGYGQPQYGYQQPSGPVTIPAGTLLQVRTAEPVSSKRAVDGTPVQFTVIQDVTAGGALAIPRGATLHGVITYAQQTGKGRLAGHDELALTLTSLDLGGQNYPLQTDEFRVKGPSKAGRTVGNAVTGGLLGTIIGCVAGGEVGCAAGAGVGAAAGVGASAASNGPGVWIPAEAQVSFHLNAPLTVNPVSQQEAARLAQGLYPGGPTLYRRHVPYFRPYGYPMMYPYGGYGYPPVYYRPYYMMGGVYYWR